MEALPENFISAREVYDFFYRTVGDRADGVPRPLALKEIALDMLWEKGFSRKKYDLIPSVNHFGWFLVRRDA